MKDLLTMQSLTATHYDNGDHILQFEPGDGREIFVTVRGLGPVDDEFYWDDEDNLARALAEVEEDDIEVQEPAMTVEILISESNLTLKDKNFVRSMIDRGILQVHKEDLPLLKYWIENEQLDGYRPTFYGGYTPERFQAEQIEQFGEEVDLEDRQWYTVMPEGIIEYYDEPGWWK